MRRLATPLIVLGLLSIPARAQTVTFSSTPINPNVSHGSWINVGTPNASDSGQELKNLIGVWNWNSEPIINRQQYTAQAAGTSTTVATSDGAAPTSYWVGGTIQILNSVNTGAEIGCSSTITANTASTITFSPACGAAIQAGDNIYLTRTVSPTSEADWESGFNRNAGVAGIVSGGGKITSATTGLCSDCGAQSVVLNATSGSSELQYYWDGNYTQNIYVLMNGNYQLRFNAYSLAGSTTALTFACSRSSGFSFSYTPTLTTSPAYYTYNFMGTETQGSTTPNEVICTASVSGGSVQFDNVSIERIETGTNTTVYRDEFVQHLIQRRPAGLRFWNYTSQNGETAANWTNPDTSHACTTAGNAYYSQGCEPSLDDYLKLVQYLSTQLGYTVGMDVEVPIGFTSTEYTNFEDYIVATSGTWATKRAANGQTSPYIPNVLPLIHAAPCNECWNGATPGQQLGYYPGSSTGTFGTYGASLNYAFSAFRGDANYVSSQWDLVANAQTGQAGGDAVVYMAQTNPPDSIELNGYGISQVNESTDAMWNGVLAWPNNITSSGDLTGLYSAVATVQGTSTCGAAKSAQCKVNIYEWNVGFSGSNQGSISQTYMDYLTAGAGAGLEYALQQLLMAQTNDIGLNAFFAAEGFNNGGSPNASIWGDSVDDGGATNLLRPQALALEVYNTAAIGTMTSCPITSNVTYNFAGDSKITFGGSSGMPAQSNIPYLYAACFLSGTQRGVVFVNVDQTNPHTVTFAGANAPTGTVSTLTYAPSSLDLLNQTSTADLPTNKATANVTLTTGSVNNPTSLTLAADSIVAYTWSVGSTPSPTGFVGKFTCTGSCVIR